MLEKLTKEQMLILDSYLGIVDRALKLSKKQKIASIRAIRELFHTLTDEREDKKTEYLNDAKNLCAYIYYYLWWNLYRMIRTFNAISIELENGDVVGDFGCGPFAFVLALWIAKPQLRNKSITFYCVDLSQRAMKAGEALFESLCNFTSERDSIVNQNKEHLASKWKIKRVVGRFGTHINEKLSLFVSANMFNELLWKKRAILKSEVKKYFNIIAEYLKEDAKILIIEPGLPIGGEIVSSFRQCMLEKGFSILSPCPHEERCAIHAKKEGGKAIAHGKWCHFLFSTYQAPSNLLQFSQNVHLAKDSASLSYIYSSNKKEHKIQLNKTQSYKNNIKEDGIKAIITSASIHLPNGKTGYYACSALGFLLVIEQEKKTRCSLKSGLYIEIDASKIKMPYKIDKKSGAIIIEI